MATSTIKPMEGITSSATVTTVVNASIDLSGGGYIRLYRRGCVVQMEAYFNVTAQIGGYATLFNIPEGFWPYFEVEIPIVAYSSGASQFGYVNAAGSVYTRHAVIASNPTIIHALWLTK